MDPTPISPEPGGLSHALPPLFTGSLAQARAALFACLAHPQGPCVCVGFLNLHNYCVACQDREVERIFRELDFVFGDGVGLQIAARCLTQVPRFPRISGTDLVPAMLADAQCRGLKVFLLGGTADFIASTAQQFTRLFREPQLAGFHPGYFTPEQEPALLDLIEACAPDILLIGMGAPAQELWLWRHRHRLNARLGICVGGLFHYWHGSLHRAPRVLSRLGLEWLWILVQQPGKWPRYTLEPWRMLRALAKHH